MVETSPGPLPSLIVVTGRPGSGKTTLAHALARAVRCPALCRDEVKEGLLHTTRAAHLPADEVAWKVYEIFFETARLLLSRRVSVVAEAAFQHKLWSPKLEPLGEIARVRIVVCTIDAQLARLRQIERNLADPGRARFHPLPPAPAHREDEEPPSTDYDPPRLKVPTLAVDTSDGYQPAFEKIVSFAHE